MDPRREYCSVPLDMSLTPPAGGTGLYYYHDETGSPSVPSKSDTFYSYTVQHIKECVERAYTGSSTAIGATRGCLADKFDSSRSR